MSDRKRRRQLAQWEAATRAHACESARNLTLQIVSGKPTGIKAYDIGVVLKPGEIVYQRAPARFQPIARNRIEWVDRDVVDWAITSHRIVGRLPSSGQIEDIEWKDIAAVTADLTSEWLALDGLYNGWRALLTGPAIAPIIVAAIASCHGPEALIDHPALNPLRVTFQASTTNQAVTAAPLAIENTHYLGPTF